MNREASSLTHTLPPAAGGARSGRRVPPASMKGGMLPRTAATGHTLHECLPDSRRLLPANSPCPPRRQGVHHMTTGVLCVVLFACLAACAPARNGQATSSVTAATATRQTTVQGGAQAALQNAPVIRPGDEAPDFDLPAVDGTRLRLASFRGHKAVVLSFVPAAFTPVCSSQWAGYGMLKPRFEALGAVVVGIAADNVPSLAAWTREMGTDAAGHPSPLWFPVVSDFWPHGAVTMRYGLLRPEGIAERALVLIDKAGVVRLVEVSDIDKRPPLDNLFKALERLAAGN